MGITKETQNIISLCTGMRGLERGVERAGIDLRVKCFVEIEAFVIENLVQQMEQGVLDEAPIWSNLKTFDAEPFRGMVDGIMGGYPCQGFSVAGKRLGADDPRHLWPYIEKFIGTIRPVWCFFENVPGHLSLGYREVRSDLERLGYAVEEGIFSAEEVGAPHQRKRLFILAVDNSLRGRYRRQEEEIRSGRYSAEFTGETATNLVNSEHNGFDGSKDRAGSEEGDRRSTTGKKSIIEFEGSGSQPTGHYEELADSDNSGECSQSGKTAGESGKIEEEEQRERRNEVLGQRMRPELSNGSESELADSEFEGLQGYSGDEQGAPGQEWSGADRSASENGLSCWPARPGEEQYEWEAPRVESSMGYAINGYNFREDLLRMAGNGVVEQTAELAFRTLLRKHGLTI